MSRYASGTSVAVEKSVADIQRTVTRFGADKFGFMQGSDRAQVGFELRGMAIRLDLMLPDRNDPRFWQTNHKRPQKRSREQAWEAWEGECRRLWRSLAAVVKAKVVAIEDGISTVEKEFLANLVLPEGQTVIEAVGPRIKQAYETGVTPRLLTDGS